jgi:SAM-dependent methyltransferase
MASLSQFRTESYQAMHGLSAALEKAMYLEANYAAATVPENIRLSRGLQIRIEKASRCLEEQELVLERLLCSPGFHPILALPDTKRISALPLSIQADDPPRTHSPSKTFTRPPPYSYRNERQQQRRTYDETGAYDSSNQIVAHLVRDWTILGAKVRHSLYDWCMQQVKRYVSKPSIILVPGAGLGRLAFDLAATGYTVEANELSPVMAAAAQGLLQWHVSGKIYPYLLDRMANEVNANARFRAVSFPDTQVIPSSTSGLALSFTIGDFVGPYYQARSTSFGAIVTCFFLDTATNIYEYLDLIHNLLTPSGIWINVGPLQWHGNAMLVPAADELRILIASRFIIKCWSMDQDPIAYRETEHVTTNYEGYRPVRFVAIRK